MKESDFGKGARPLNPIHRKWRKLTRTKVGEAPFDWNVGYDVRNTIGPIPIKNQGQSDSCGGQAASYLVQILEVMRGKKEVISAKSIYCPIAYPGGGTTVSDLETQVSAKGANLESSVPSYYADGITPLSEALMIEKSWMVPNAVQDAFTRAGYTPFSVSVDIDSVANAVQNYGALIWEIQGQNGNTPSWLSSTPQPPNKTNPNDKWQHFMCIVGARTINGEKMIIALNSWGTSIGDGGVQYFGESYFNAGGIIEVIGFEYDAQIAPIAQNTDVWASLCAWFRSLWGLRPIAALL